MMPLVTQPTILNHSIIALSLTIKNHPLTGLIFSGKRKKILLQLLQQYVKLKNAK